MQQLVVWKHFDDSIMNGGKAEIALAGLDVLAQRGIEVAMLYVDAANTPAVKLYVGLGFTLDHIDRAYQVTV